MAKVSVARQRLHYQGLVPPRFEDPAEVVRWMGAVQAQEYAPSLWGLGLRLRPELGATEASVEQAVREGRIVRGWPMRGTIHFMAAEDVRWMQDLLAPRRRMLINNMARYARADFDEATYAETQAVFAQALRGGKHLTRLELAEAVAQAGIDAQGHFDILLHRALADSQIVYGLRRGKTLTHVLLDEWVPWNGRGTFSAREEAVGALAERYFTSHGPALVEDFAWWTGLTKGETRIGLEAAGSKLGRTVIKGREYWHAPEPPPEPPRGTSAHLLPPYDELTIAYRVRDDYYDPSKATAGEGAAFLWPIVVDGVVVGMWRRTLRKDSVLVEIRFFQPPSRAARRAVKEAAGGYAAFVGLRLEVEEKR
jgi:hypothetical protein